MEYHYNADGKRLLTRNRELNLEGVVDRANMA